MKTLEAFVQIPCEERLPEKSGKILVINPVIANPFEAYFYEEDKSWQVGSARFFAKDSGITHWLEQQTIEVYDKDDMKRAISAGLSVGYSPNYNLDNREKEMANILSTLSTTSSEDKSSKPLFD